MITVKIINIDNPLYEQEIELRNKILRRPIGMPDNSWDMQNEKAWHFVALNKDKLIGCVLLLPNKEEKDKVRLIQMAVDNDYQGTGIGKLLINELLHFCKEKKIQEVTCHARDNAVIFYQKMGFEVYDEPFYEVGILHKHMRKYI